MPKGRDIWDNNWDSGIRGFGDSGLGIRFEFVSLFALNSQLSTTQSSYEIL